MALATSGRGHVRQAIPSPKLLAQAQAISTLPQGEGEGDCTLVQPVQHGAHAVDHAADFGFARDQSRDQHDSVAGNAHDQILVEKRQLERLSPPVAANTNSPSAK